MSLFKLSAVIVFSIFIIGCSNKKQADLMLTNGVVYTVDSAFSTCSSVVIKDGKIVFTGSDKDAASAYDAREVIDLQGRPVYPGFIDAHCHFYGYGVDMKKINLIGTKSWNDVLDKLKQNRANHFSGWIFGRGWDQNDWEDKSYPDKSELDSLFPDVPVFLLRIDGHAAMVNQKALDLARISAVSKIPGGEVVLKDGRLTGLLIDNAADSIKKIIGDPSLKDQAEALISAQEKCFEVGLTTVDDAGLDRSTIELMDSLHKQQKLKMRIYAMVTYDEANKSYFFKRGKIKTDRLNVRSFKIYADGALGSRGACLLASYTDRPGHYGFLLHGVEAFRNAAQELYSNDFQMNTHCIGDSANLLMLYVYGSILKGKNDLRWRIEHCQVLDPQDMELFARFSILPSVQPTHATSDMYWAHERIGNERLKGAYAYKSLLNKAGLLPLGTDFPVEGINPLNTFYAAVSRRDTKGFPQERFMADEALSREEALKGMTLWAAYSNFEEKEKGSIEPGKMADLVILEEDIMKVSEEKLPGIKVFKTILNGEQVYTRK